MLNEIIDIRVQDASKVSENLIGKYRCSLGSLCVSKRQITRKWILLSTEEKETEPKGFLKISLCICYGDNTFIDDVFGDPNSEDTDKNVILPEKVLLENITFFIKVYLGEDLPPDQSYAPPPVVGMSPVELTKNIFASSSHTIDPYFCFDFAGHKIKTSIKENSVDPIYNEELLITTQFPSVCDALRILFFDK